MTSKFVGDVFVSPLLAASCLVAMDEASQADDPIAKMSDWLIDLGYGEAFDNVISALADARNNSLAAWASYFTLYQGQSPWGRLLIGSDGTVSLNGQEVQNVTLADMVLSWPPAPGGGDAATLKLSSNPDGSSTLDGQIGATTVRGVRGRFGEGGGANPDPIGFWSGAFLITREVRPAGQPTTTPTLEQHVLTVTDGAVALDGTELADAYQDGVVTWQGVGRGQFSGRLAFSLRPEDGVPVVLGHIVLDDEELPALPNAVGWRVASLVEPSPARVTKGAAETPHLEMLAAAEDSAINTPPPPPLPPVIEEKWAGNYSLSIDGTTSLVHLSVSSDGKRVQIEGVGLDGWTYSDPQGAKGPKRLQGTTADGWSYDLGFSTDISDVTHKLIAGERTRTGTSQHLYGDNPRYVAEQWSGKDIASFVTSVVGGVVLAGIAAIIGAIALHKSRQDAKQTGLAQQDFKKDMKIQLKNIGSKLANLQTPDAVSAKTLKEALRKQQKDRTRQLDAAKIELVNYTQVLVNELVDVEIRIKDLEAKLAAERQQPKSDEGTKRIAESQAAINAERDKETKVERAQREAEKHHDKKDNEKEIEMKVEHQHHVKD